MQYNEEDFKNLFWNPFGNPKNVRKLWNTINQYKEFQAELTDLDEDFVFNYIEMVYHKDCILVKDFQDNYQDRKQKAIELLIDKPKNNKEEAAIKKMFEGGDPVVNRMIIRFCTLQKSQEYALLVNTVIGYDRLLFSMHSRYMDDTNIEKTVTDASKIQVQLQNLLKSINDLKLIVFQGDKKVGTEVDEDLLGYARVEGFTELIVKGKIKLPKA